MIYSQTITTAKSTTQVEAKRTEFRITSGLIYRIEVEFPSGPSGLLHAQVYDGDYQLFPATRGEDVHSDGTIIGFDDLYLKTTSPFIFIVKTWNEDTFWSHEVQVRIAIASQEAFMSRYMPSLSWEKFSKTMADVLAYQEKLRAEQLSGLGKEIGEF